jgi:hypothetical protein
LYALTSTTNPDHRLHEADYTNNTATIYLAIVGRTVAVIDGPEASPETCLVAGWC